MIPARMASSRFPGKPLIRFQDLPMIEHVRRRAALCHRFSEVVVATCDLEIAQVVEGFGGKVMMTASHHPGATDRVAQAADRIDCTHVVNVQGDEILVLPQDLEKMVQAIEARPDLPAWNAVARIEQRGELSDRSVVKGVVSRSGKILFCARDFSVSREEANGSFEPVNRFEPIRKILGILGYRRDFVRSFGSLVRTPFETAESIDQMRIIEHEIPLQGVEFKNGYLGVNEPREVERVQRCLKEDPAQRRILEEILAGAKEIAR